MFIVIATVIVIFTVIVIVTGIVIVTVIVTQAASQYRRAGLLLGSGKA